MDAKMRSGPAGALQQRGAGLEPRVLLALAGELGRWVRKQVGPIAALDHIQWAPALPKTRSGKIMRRILRKITENDCANLGDVSTLAEPGVVEALIRERQTSTDAMKAMA